MCGPLGTIAIRPRLEICLEDRFQYQLERTLDYSITDRGYRQDAEFPPVLRYLPPPCRQRPAGTFNQFARICSRNASTPCASMTSNVTPSIPGAPLFNLAISYASRCASVLQTWTYKPQKRQDGSAFALTYSPRLRSCKLRDVFVISSLPPMLLRTLQTAGPLRSVSVTRLHRYYGPVRHPLAFDPFPGFSGYRT